MPLATVADPRGLKRICLSCSTRFYDMNKRPIICPNCGAEFTGEIKVKTRRGRVSAVEDAVDDQVVSKVDADELEDEAEDTDTVSLEDVEAEDADEDEDAIDLDADDLDDDLDDDDLDDDDDDLDVDVDDDDDK